MEKITKREMFVMLSGLAEEGKMDLGDEMLDAVKSFCDKEIELLDKKAVKAKERAAAKAKQSDALTDLVRDALDVELQTIPDIAATVAEKDPEATVAKVQYRLTKLVEAGEVEKEDVTIPATETSKTRRVKGYRLATPQEVEE